MSSAITTTEQKALAAGSIDMPSENEPEQIGVAGYIIQAATCSQGQLFNSLSRRQRSEYGTSSARGILRMNHIHGTPIWPEEAAAKVLAGRHAMVSFARPDQLELALDVCQTVVADNGGFSAWKSGKPITDWNPYYSWTEGLLRHPSFDWAIIPDVIDGTEWDNDKLIAEWPFGKHVGVPVWHMHESLTKLNRLATEWPRVALGSSGEFATVGTAKWWNRMAEAMDTVCIGKQPKAKLHGLRMLDPEIFSRLPLASADSTNVAQNVGIDGKWRGSYLPPNRSVRGIVLAERIEAVQSAPCWEPCAVQLELLA